MCYDAMAYTAACNQGDLKVHPHSNLAPRVKEAGHLTDSRQSPGDGIADKEHRVGGMPCKDRYQPDNSHEAGADQCTEHRHDGVTHATRQAGEYVHYATGKIRYHHDK